MISFPRTRTILALGLASAGLALGLVASAADEDTKLVDYLFVHNAKSAKIVDGVLTLGGVNADTLYFSDRPDRIVGRVTSQEFVDTWGKGSDSFKADPPNAVLSILEGDETQDVTVELRNPRLADGNLVYDVKVLDGDPAASGAASALFIDVIGMPRTPMSYAGVARRTTRRVVRY